MIRVNWNTFKCSACDYVPPDDATGDTITAHLLAHYGENFIPPTDPSSARVERAKEAHFTAVCDYVQAAAQATPILRGNADVLWAQFVASRDALITAALDQGRAEGAARIAALEQERDTLTRERDDAQALAIQHAYADATANYEQGLADGRQQTVTQVIALIDIDGYVNAIYWPALRGKIQALSASQVPPATEPQESK